jgi:4-amino-4-deoxy-L-arabinose transferase-like glycosyltransferase
VPGASLAGLAVLVAAGLGLRIAGLDQTLYGDEYFTHSIVTRGGLGDVWHLVYTTSITPPFHYALAWLSVQLGGDSTILVRLPSLVLGTALIPLVYALGARVASVRAGLIAAGLIALGSFSVWYADEARAYATMMFLLALGAYGLLRAVRGDGARWWALWAVASCLALWSHYTALFVVLGMAGWVVLAHPERRRAALVAATGIAAGFAPWIPGFLNQRTNQVGIASIEEFAELTPTVPVSVPAKTLIGHPFFDLVDFPGWVGVALVGLAVAFVAGAAWRHRPARPERAALRADGTLILVLAVATPAGLLLYAATGTSLWLPRNLSASLPFLSIVVAAVVAWASTRLPARAGAAGLAVLGTLFLLLTVRSETDGYRRPPYREAARWVDRHAAPTAPVIEIPLALSPDPRLPPTSVDLYLPARHRVVRTGSDGALWRGLAAGRELWLIAFSRFSSSGAVRFAWGDRTPPRKLLDRARRIGGPDGLGLGQEERHFDGVIDVDAQHFRGRASGVRRGDRITWTFGRNVRIVPHAAKGAIDGVTRPARPVLEGWALPASGRGRVGWILLFRGRRLVGASAGGLDRPDVARLVGPAAAFSGWRASPLGPKRALRSVRAYAVVGNRATALPAAPAVARALR